MRFFVSLLIVLCLPGCLARNPVPISPTDSGGPPPFQGFPIGGSPTLVYYPPSEQLFSWDSLSYGETLKQEAKRVDVDEGVVHDQRPAVNNSRHNLPIEHRDVQTSLVRLSGWGARYPNWIFDSEPRGAAIAGLNYISPLRTPQKIMNLPKEKISQITALGRGAGPCYYNQAIRKTIVEEGLEWIHLLCRFQVADH